MSKKSRRVSPTSRNERRAAIKAKRPEIVVSEETWGVLAFRIERGADHPLLIGGVPVTVLPTP